MLFYIIAILVIAMDQLSKYLIRTYIALGDVVPFLGMEITHYENSGMAHSLFQGYGRLFAIVAILFVIGVFYYRKTGEFKGVLVDISFGFLVGGAVGNAMDRIWFGQVTDFLTSRNGKGILNLADHAIELGILFFILHGVARLVKRRKRRQ